MAIKLGIRHMQMIEQIAECGSVTEAANRIGLTQSALSHRIRETERLLNTAIFYRKNKMLTLTNAGKRMLYSAKVILGEIERAEYDIGKLSEGIESIVRLGSDLYGSYHWLPQFLKFFSPSHPEIGTEIIADISLDPLSALRQGNIDLAIITTGLQTDIFQTNKLFTDELLAILPKNHPYGTKSWLEPEDFTNQTYIAHHTTPEKGLVYEQLFSRHNVLPAHVMRMGVMDVIIDFVQQGFGISILPQYTIKHHLTGHNLTAVRVTEQGLFVDWHVARRKHEPITSPTSVFADALANWSEWE